MCVVIVVSRERCYLTHARCADITSDLDLSDSTFTSNRNGPALWCCAGTDNIAMLTRVTFKDNVGSNTIIQAADINAWANSITISNCHFSNSQGGTGDGKESGAVMCKGG